MPLSTAIIETSDTDTSHNRIEERELNYRIQKWDPEQFDDTSPNGEDEPVFVQVGDKWVELDLERIRSYSKDIESAILGHIDSMLSLMRFPEKWRLENISEPTSHCKDLAKETAEKLFYKAKLIPFRIAPSVEEGVMLTYYNQKNNKTLMVEVYNDLEIAGIVNQNKTILLSQDITNGNFEKLLDKYIL